MKKSKSAGALEGVLIADLSRYHAGPYATTLLADMGAEVIKVEAPEGDPMRGVSPLTGDLSSFRPAFEFANRNKKSLVLDLRLPAHKDVLLKLIDKADVLYHNFRLGVMERLGLDYETLRARNPCLIYASASAFGERGPWRAKPGYDPCAQAVSGLMACTGEPDWPYVPVGAPIVDQSAAIMGALAVMVALFERERSGLGQKVEVSLLGSSLALQARNTSEQLATGLSAGRHGQGRVWGNAVTGSFRCQDGRYLVLAAIGPQREALLKVMNLNLQTNRRFVRLKGGEARDKVLMRVLHETFETKPRQKWLDLLDKADVPCAPVLEYAEILNHPQTLKNDYVVSYRHPEAGRIKSVGFPIKLSRTPAKVRRPAPKVGEQTKEILRSLGYSEAEIARLAVAVKSA